jgi:hypothetical protein
LVKRGSLTVWFDEKRVSSWYSTKQTGKKGRPYTYSDIAIQTALTFRILFRLPLRATQGLTESLCELLKLDIHASDYTTLSRRQKKLKVKLSHRKTNEPLHLVIDSSGLKVYGEGEWMVKKHGKSYRRTWRKLHIAVDPKIQDIVAAEVTKGSTHDCTPFDNLLLQVNDIIRQLSADGAYDMHRCYEAAVKLEAIPNFPPRKNALLHKPSDKAWILRNHAIMDVRRRGLKKWKKKTGYHKRSLSETAFFRLKRLFGHHVLSSDFENQKNELLLRCRILNQMNQLGMPDSYLI